MTDASETPRRTVRIPDDEWDAGQRAAAANNDNLSAVIRRGIADYAKGSPVVEYRATSRTIAGLVVDVAADLADVRAHFPARYWTLDAREVGALRPARRDGRGQP